MTKGGRWLRRLRRAGVVGLGVLLGLAVGWLAGELVGGTQTLADGPHDGAPAAAEAAAAAGQDKPQAAVAAEEVEASAKHHGGEINPGGDSIVTPTRQAEKSGGDKAPAEAAKKAGAADEADGEIIKTLPHIVVDRKAGTVSLEGEVVLQDGMLELFVCAAGMRQHESVVHVKARPLNIQLALLLLGLKSGNSVSWTAEGEFLPAAGPEVRVFVEYAGADGKQRRVEAHEWMNDAFDQPAKPQRWVFAGSAMVEDQFMADLEGTVVCTSNFSSAILDLPFESTAMNDQLVFKARKEAIPEPGTQVRVILQPTGKVVEGKKLVWVYVIDKDNKITLEGEPSSPEALREKLSKRDKYLRKVEVYAHPQSRVEHTFAAMKVISDFSALQMQVLPLLNAESPGSDAGEPTKPEKAEQ